MAFTNRPTRVATAKERLRGLLTDALAAMARERLNGMSNEEQRSFLTVRVEDLQAHYHNPEWLIVLADATKFVTNTEAWFYFLCPECNRAFLEAEHFESHVEEEHTRELKLLLSNVPRSVAYKQTGFLESWISPKPTDIPLESKAHQGNEIVRKIKDAVLHLKDRKALSVKLVDKLVEFTKGWLGKTAAVPKDLSCIASLDHAGLQVLGSYLERLQTSSGDWSHERACGGEHDSPDVVDVVIQIQDASVLSVDIDKIVSGRDAGSSTADVLFSWLCLREERLPSWASMRQDCIAKGIDVLEKMDKMKDLLMKQVNLKSGLSNMNEDYFRREALVDVGIFRIHAEVDYLKGDLVKACRFDYYALILPVMKAHLWHKLNSESPGKGLQGVDDEVAEESLTIRYASNVQNDSDEAELNNGSPGKGLNGVDNTGSNVSRKKRDDPIVFQSVGGEPLLEYSTLTTAKQISDSPGKSSPTVGDKGAKGNLEKGDDSFVLVNVCEDLTDDSNAMLNSDPAGNEKNLSEVDDRGGVENLENTDNLNALHQEDDEVEVLSEDHNVSKSDQQIELPPTAREQDNLGDAEQTSMTSRGTSNFNSHMKDQPIIAEKAKVASSSDCSGSTMGTSNISTDEGNITACQNGHIELQSLNMTLRSLWHLRHFSDWYKNTAPVIPHFGVAGNHCVICKLHQLFSAWDSKDDIRPTFVVRYMRTSFSKILNDANVSQKEETNIAVKITEIIFNMIHLSQTAFPASCPTREMRYQTMTTSSCADKKCTVHNLFGMRKNEENKYTCFVNLDASELLNVEMKSFSEVIKAVNKRFNSDTESSGYSHLPRFFTTVFRQPSDRESHFDVSGLLVSIAAPLDIGSFCEGLHSECKYTVLSAVFRAEDRDVCFARQQDKWRIYDDSTVKDADSWENVLDGYSQSRLYPKIIFFEQYSSATE